MAEPTAEEKLKKALADAKLAELAEEGEDAIEKLKKRLKDIRVEAAAAFDETMSAGEALKEANKKRLQIIEAIATARKNSNLQALEENKKLLAAQNEFVGKLEELKQASEDYNIEVQSLSEDGLKPLIDRTDEAKSMQDGYNQGMADFAKMIPVVGDSLSKLINIKGKVIKNSTSLAKTFGTLAKKLNANTANGTFLGNMAAGLSGKFSALSSAATAVTGAMLAGGAIILAMTAYVVAMTTKMEKLEASFRKQIDTASVFRGQLTKMTFEMKHLGISAEELAGSTQGLLDNFSAFNMENEETNKSLIKTSSMLEKLGVSSSESAKMMDHFNRAMGQTEKQSANTTAQIAMMGRAINISSAKMIQDFAAASSRLAIYGNKSIDVFKGLAAQAKATGIAVQTLLSISQKFDTFDGAANSIAQLNAVLGTNLSTVEMLAANDEQRIKMLKEQIKMSVGNFDSLDKYTKMYVAQAMGVSDVAEAQRLLNMSTAEYQKYQKGQQESADIQKAMSDAVIEAMPMFTKLVTILSAVLKIFSPLIYTLGIIAGLINKVAGFLLELYETSQEFSVVVDVLAYIFKGALFVGLVLIAAKLAGFASVTVGVVAAIGYLIASLLEFFDVIHLSGSPMLYEMPGYIADGFIKLKDGVVNAGSAIANFARNSMKGLYDIFHLSGSPELWELPGIFAQSFIDMADSVGRVFKNMTKYIEMLIEFSKVDFKGFAAIRTDGSSTSMIMGSKDVVTSLNKGKLTVDVKMPELKMPDINVKVFIGDTELRNMIRTEVEYVVGGAQ